MTVQTNTSEARERPIIFSAPMVRAILAGRKSQTRRALKLPPKQYERTDMGGWEPCTNGGGGCFRFGRGGVRVPVPETVGIWHRTTGWCQDAPYQIGDRLWVRETWQVTRETTDYETGGEYDVYAWDEDLYGDPRQHLSGCARYGVRAGLFYRADGEDKNPSDFYPLIGIKGDVLRPAEIGWRSPIFMPRWASRLTLEVTEVRVERLQSISDEDVRAEGALRPARDLETGQDGYWAGKPDDARFVLTRREAFAALWNSIHGKDAWDANPWVAAITFRRLTDNAEATHG